MRELPKAYNPQGAEENLYKLWEESGFFAPEAHPPWAGSPETNPNYGKTFTIIMPPTNANGDLHAGHGLVMTLEDIMIRFNRMRGKKTLWLPGNDHAGFETQVVYEKVLEKQGRSRFDIAPEDLYKEIWGFTQNNRSNINSQVKKIGASCDWSREKFTLDRDIVKTVYSTFEKLFHEGLIYRGKKIVSWCPKHQTSFSDLEIVDEERTDKFYYVKYGPFTIGTARPETKFGDKYVVMHPADKRYQQYKDGQKIELEWINGPITATVVKDEAVDMEFGTGIIKVTPAHDFTDFETGHRHHLQLKQVIGFDGKLNKLAGPYQGLYVNEARKKIVEDLKTKGLMVKTKEDAERERLGQEYREKEAKMTPEGKVQRAEEWARQDRNWMAEWFEDGIKKNGEYSEALQIKQDGSLDREKRMDGWLPYLVSEGDLKSPEDLYQLMYKISLEHPDLNISFDVDPNRKWIKYRVSKKVEDEK